MGEYLCEEQEPRSLLPNTTETFLLYPNRTELQSLD